MPFNLLFQSSPISMLRSSGFNFGKATLPCLLMLLGLAGCRSYLDMSYLSNLDIQGRVAADSSQRIAHHIQPGDNLFINVISGNAELDALYNPSTAGTSNSSNVNNIWAAQSSQYVFGYLVNPNGTVELPTFGALQVSGLTLTECEQAIRERARQVLKEVTVRVRLLNYRVTILGEVFNPGIYFNYNPSINIFEALGLANGAKNTAALNQVLVLRKQGNGNKVIRLNLNDAAVLGSEAYLIRPNDVIIVQPATYKNAELKLPIISIVASSVTTLLLILNFVANNY